MDPQVAEKVAEAINLQPAPVAKVPTFDEFLDEVGQPADPDETQGDPAPTDKPADDQKPAENPDDSKGKEAQPDAGNKDQKGADSTADRDQLQARVDELEKRLESKTQ